MSDVQMDMLRDTTSSYDATVQNNVENVANNAQLSGRERQLAALRAYGPKPGETRNPRGRPKKDFDLAREAQKHAQKAVQTLVAAMMDESAAWPVRTNAASTLLDRGFGKAPQSLDIKHEMSFSDEFEAFVRRLSTAGTEKPVALIEAEIEAEDAEFGPVDSQKE